MLLDRRSLIAGLTVLTAPSVWARGPARYPAPDREVMVPVEGGRVYVRVNGNLAGAKPPVVFIHGGPGGSHAGFLDALALSDERAVILYDQLDSGRSDRPMKPGNWRVPRFVDEVDAVRRALGVERWHVCGHSWGGTVALEYGARRPAALVSLILSSPLISTRSWIADANLLRTQLPAETQAMLTTCDRQPANAGCDAATKAFYARFLSREPASDGQMAYRAQMGTLGTNTRLYEAMWGRSEFVSTGSLKSYDGEPLLRALDGSRTLFIGGQYDEARPTTLDMFAARVPGAGFAAVPGAGHGFLSDRPAEAVGNLRAWLKRNDPV
jgi:proline-specific peptidase